VYAAALLSAERVALGREPSGALLLQQLAPPDTALERELLRRHAIAGICHVSGPFSDACTNDVRGFTATVLALPRPAAGDSAALAILEVRPMRAAHDRTWLVGSPPRIWLIMLSRRDSTWAASPGFFPP
jgi:hypothetical protein